MKRILALFLLLLLGTHSLFAQDATMISPDEAAEFPHVLSLVHTVEVMEQDDQPTLLIFGTMPDGCERETFVTKERQGPILFVDVYHAPVPASVVGCPKKLIPLALTIPAEELLTMDDNATLPSILAVNDHYYAINIAAIEAMPDAGLPPIMLTPLTRVPVMVHSLSTQAHDDGFVDVIIKGVQTQGCSDAVLSRVWTISKTTHEYVIDVFQALPDSNACPDTYVAVVFEIAVKTPVERDTAGMFTVDGKTIAHTPGAEGSPMRVFHSIESVDALLMESAPVQIMLKVKGYQTDGCDMPVQTQQSREGNTVTVQIFRNLPPDMACTMMYTRYESTVKLDGGFEPGTYAIDVNGMVITVKI